MNRRWPSSGPSRKPRKRLGYSSSNKQNQIEQRNKKRHEKLTQVKRERNKNIRIEIKKFKKIQEGFAEYMKARKEKWFSGERDLSQIMLKTQSDLEEKDSPKRKRNKLSFI
jgi:hypothetical protein